ncbi:AAA family ATPase, partial [Anaerorhabdus sp.]
AESFYNVASQVDELYEDEFKANAPTSFGNISLHNQSHGESFLALVQNRFFGQGLYILDEPEAALSPSRQMTLLVEFDRLVKQKSQLIIATHSPILLSYPGAIIYQITTDGIEQVCYDDCEHVTLMKEYLNHPERMLKYLLEDE